MPNTPTTHLESPLDTPPNQNKLIATLMEAMETLDAKEPTGRNTVLEFLKGTNLRINLVEGDYEAGLRGVSKRIDVATLGEQKLKDTPFLGIIIALLGRLKKKSPIRKGVMQRSPKQQELEDLVTRYLGGGSTSPSGVMSIVGLQSIQTERVAEVLH